MSQKKPTTLELAKALHDVSSYVGQLPTNAEKDAICEAIHKLVAEVLTAHQVTPEEASKFFGDDGPIKAAAKSALAGHCDPA